jgi:S1-C subfamily serine protease
MLEDKNDKLVLMDNKQEISELEVVKHDYTTDLFDVEGNDLTLLRALDTLEDPEFYVELADNEPVTGTEIDIVGNPMGIEDVISDGRVIVYKDNFMYYIDHTYYGNSGGGVYNQDSQLIGIVSHMWNLKPTEDSPDYVINGAVRLNTIKEFLKDIA